MRSLSRFMLIGLTGLALAAPVAVTGQRSDDQIAPKSIEFERRGEALLAAGKLDDAEDALDPPRS